MLAEMNMGSAVYATPVPANGALFIINRNQLFALLGRPRNERPYGRSVTGTGSSFCRGLMACAPAPLAQAPAPDGWPQFRGNARLTGTRHFDAHPCR